MCTGKCSRCIAATLYPLVLLSITCNILLFFPGWDDKYVKDGHLTNEVMYMGGIIGGGVMVFICALYISLTGEKRCCGNRLGMFVSIIFAGMGAVGALYSFGVAFQSLHYGPFCKSGGRWTTPFKDSNWTYLTDSETWRKCTEPKNVVQFNTGLFLTLMVTSCLQILLCAVQIVNGLIGCVCGACISKEEL